MRSLQDLFLLTNKSFQFLSVIKHQYRHYCLKSFAARANLIASRDHVSIAHALSVAEDSKSRFLGAKIHAGIIRLGLVDDIFLQNNLIKMYAKCGVLGDGLQVFDEMTDRNLVSWTLIISGAIRNEEHELGLEIYLAMMRSGQIPNEFGVASVLKACATLGAYRLGLAVHSLAFKLDLEKNLYVGGSVMSMYAKLEDVQSAERVLASIPDPDICCWNSMIGAYVQRGLGVNALVIMCYLRRIGIITDSFTFIYALKGCSVTGDLDFGKQLHGLIIKSEMESITSLMNCLMDMYFGVSKDSALKVFSQMKHKDVISWNIIFSHLFEITDRREITSLLRQFMLAGISPNHITFSVLFRQCGDTLALDLGLQIYCLATKFGFSYEVSAVDSIIYMFSRCKNMFDARNLFDTTCVKGVSAWNELISGYGSNNSHLEALEIFSKLWGLGAESNEYTFSGVLEASSKHLNHHVFTQIHGIVMKYGYASNGHVSSLLINGYVNYGLLRDAFKFFDGVDSLDVVSWGTMITALVGQGHIWKAIKVMNIFMEADGKPDEFIVASVLNYCAKISAYHLTNSFHSLIIKTGLETHPFVASGVIDAYAKCGDINGAKTAYTYTQSLHWNDVVVYNTMITSYAHHGLVKEAVKIFETIKLMNLNPSQATFVSVISACNHIGFIEEGLRLFETMISDYEMEPSRDVYGCVVDMLSRNGRLENAKRVLEEMPYALWPEILRAFLSGCRVFGNRELGEWSAEKLACLAPEDDAPFLLHSRVYAETGGVKSRPSAMEKGVLKDAACSWIEM